MSADRTPWWYSGDDAVAEEPVAEEPVGEQPNGDEDPGSLDWTALALGAQRLVDWASERLLTPHAEHTDPRANPGCVVCRTQVLLGESGSGTGPAPSPVRSMPVVEWIPIVEAADKPSDGAPAGGSPA